MDAELPIRPTISAPTQDAQPILPMSNGAKADCPRVWAALMRHGMTGDFGIQMSSAAYLKGQRLCTAAHPANGNTGCCLAANAPKDRGIILLGTPVDRGMLAVITHLPHHHLHTESWSHPACSRQIFQADHLITQQRSLKSRQLRIFSRYHSSTSLHAALSLIL